MSTISREMSMAFLLAWGLLAGCGAEEAKAAGKKEDPYPIDTCIVSGKKLTEIGGPHVYDHKGRTIQFCCKGCVSKFEAKADEFGKKLDEAIIAKQLGSYPLKICVVSGDKLDEPFNYVYMNRLIQFCCDGCVNAFIKEPSKFLKVLDAAAKPVEGKLGEAKSGPQKSEEQKDGAEKQEQK